MSSNTNRDDSHHPQVPRVRPAQPQDIPVLVQFACAMAQETEHKTLDVACVQRGIATLLAAPHRGRYLVAERAGAIVGTLMVTLEWSDWRCADWWWIQSVYVLPAARRSGVFRALYLHLRDEAARDPGVCGLRLYVEHDNRAAQATYTGLGMERSHYLLYEQPLQPDADAGADT